MKDYFIPFEPYGEDNFIEKRSKFTGRLWHVETPEEESTDVVLLRLSFFSERQEQPVLPCRTEKW